jgi:hypothetical protein
MLYNDGMLITLTHFDDSVRWSNNGAWKRFKAVSTGADVYSSMSMMADYKSLCYYSWTMTQVRSSV